jgi:hypothetical protein
MSQPKHEGHRDAFDFKRLLFLAVVVLLAFVVLALAFIQNGTEKWVTLGFKILELSTQVVLVAMLGGVLVQAYIKSHSRESAMNELVLSGHMGDSSFRAQYEHCGPTDFDRMKGTAR